MNLTECPCGCGQEVPQRGSNCWTMTDPYWEWVCTNMNCKVNQTLMQNQSGDLECSWCGRDRQFIGHFETGCRINSATRRMVSGKVVRRPPHAAELITRTPLSRIRPFQDVT